MCHSVCVRDIIILLCKNGSISVGGGGGGVCVCMFACVCVCLSVIHVHVYVCASCRSIWEQFYFT